MILKNANTNNKKETQALQYILRLLMTNTTKSSTYF